MFKSIPLLFLAAVSCCRAETTIALLEEKEAEFRDVSTGGNSPPLKSGRVKWLDPGGHRLVLHDEDSGVLAKFRKPVVRVKEPPSAPVKARFLLETTAETPLILTLYDTPNYVTVAKAYESAPDMWQAGRAEDNEFGNANDEDLGRLLTEKFELLRERDPEKDLKDSPLFGPIDKEYSKAFGEFLDSPEFLEEYEKAAERASRAGEDPGEKPFYLAGFIRGVSEYGTLEGLSRQDGLGENSFIRHGSMRQFRGLHGWAAGCRVGYRVGERIRTQVTARLLRKLDGIPIEK